MVLAGSVAGLMKEAIAQHMVPSALSAEVLNHFKAVCHSRNTSSSSKQGGQSPFHKNGKQQQRDRRSSGNYNKGKGKEEAMAKVVHPTRRNSSSTRTRGKHTL